MTGVAETARDSMDRAARLMGLREKYRRRVQSKTRALMLLGALFVSPYITVANAQEILSVSNPTARHAVGALQRVGMLKEVSGRKWGQLYVARPILAAIDEPL